jgi:hypothetical protein
MQRDDTMVNERLRSGDSFVGGASYPRAAPAVFGVPAVLRWFGLDSGFKTGELLAPPCQV